MNLARLLNQSEVWTDRHGVDHRLADMEPRYCQNVVGFLLRQADQVAFYVGFALASVGLPDEDTQAYLHVTAEIDAETERMLTSPSGWLIEKPLIKALLQRAEGK
jgi:hypothetical protein